MPSLRIKKNSPQVALDYKVCDIEGSRREKLFVGSIPIQCGSTKSVSIKDEGGVISDYQDVEIEGYASTWNNLDRDGETFKKGAFKDTIAAFMQNPMMLRDHCNCCEDAVGRYDEVREDRKGLFVHGLLSNAPDCQSLRFKVVEKIIKTFSVAGKMYFDDTGISIFKIDLWEITLIPIPANPQAVFDALKGANEQLAGRANGKNQLDAGSRATDRRINPPGIRLGGFLIKP